MLLATLPSSEPKLPPELELKIFKTCYLACPALLPTLLLVCRRVFEWLNAIRYYSMYLCFESDVKSAETWIQTQRPESIQQNVKALLIDTPSKYLFARIGSVVSKLGGLEILGICVSNDDDLENSGHLVALEFMLHAFLTSLPNLKHLTLCSDGHYTRTNILESYLASA
ncbi:hypothetical protein DL96DRAFT_1811919 [Flagelloscypha sp. PMI_526]|nr:hypothetical protein DL96DRAFT_1811919 [Flagelloscypha sp. PMI_526]